MYLCLIGGIQGTSALRQCYTSSDYVTQKCLGGILTKENYCWMFKVSTTSILNISITQNLRFTHTKHSSVDKYYEK